MKAIAGAVLSIALAAPAAAAEAERYLPTPFHIVVLFTPGGSNDLMGRAVAHKLNEAWGQPAIVDNRSGGGSTVGTEAKNTADRFAPGTDPGLTKWFAEQQGSSRVASMVTVQRLARVVDATPYLGRIEAPVLAIYPSRGPITTPEQGALLRTHVRNLRLLHLPSEYHNLHLIFEDPQVKFRDTLVETEHPVLGKVRVQNVVPRFKRNAGAIRWLGKSEIGADTEPVLQELGYEPAWIEQLAADGVIRVAVS